MRLPFSNDIADLLAQVFPKLKLEIIIDDSWGSHNELARKKIREVLLLHIESAGIKLSHDEKIKILDLKKLPRLTNFKASIAHSPLIGGFAFTPTSSKIGFDIESGDRIKSEIVLRVASEKEKAAAPSAAHLWTAKEATFKALSENPKLKTLSQIETLHWIPLKNNFWVFKSRVDGTIYGSGVSGPFESQHFALFQAL